MADIRKLALPASVCLLAPAMLFADEPSRYELSLGADLSYVDANGYASWVQGGAGKLRYDSDNDGLLLTRAFADLDLRIADTVNLKLATELYDDFGSLAGITEAFLEWRPLTESGNRYRFKLGEFYPRISLENTAAGWGSPYSITPSAINTWIGEEIRLQGVEASFSRRPTAFGGAHTFSLNAAVFYANDPAGTLLSWKGWSAHDRQSRLGDELPLPPVPQIQDGGFFAAQDPYTEPFLEIDGAAGYYLTAEWSVTQQFLLRATHYDNRADPESAEGGQFGWRTYFDHLAVQTSLPGDVGLIAQWMDGETAWGYVVNGARVVDVEYTSWFALLTRSFTRHRVSLRYDRFATTENDQIPLDSNVEDGSVWMLAYQFEVSKHLKLAAEWLQIDTTRDAFEYFGLARSVTERQFQLSAQLRFSMPN
jgi:hypothetical protein